MNERLKQIRKEIGLTQSEFAERISLSRNYIAVAEIGNRVISDRTIKDICREFNVNEEWLRTGTGEMFRPVSEREELMAWIAEINRLPHTAVQRRVARMLTMLEPQDWITIDKMITALKEEQ